MHHKSGAGKNRPIPERRVRRTLAWRGAAGGTRPYMLSMLLLTGVVSQLVAVEPSPELGSADQMIKPIELTDPVYPEQPKRKHDLVVYRDHRGFPAGYTMNLVNKVCLDDICRVVEVTVHWDVTGTYERLEYPQGKPLTKRRHEPFQAGDYEKLDDILKDRESILKDHSLAYLARAGTKSENPSGVDGISGATPATVRQAVVKDAAWTTWVLWQYANTEIVPMLEATTKAHCTPAYIQHMLKSNDWRHVAFVLKYLLKQDTISSDYTMQVVQCNANGRQRPNRIGLAVSPAGGCRQEPVPPTVDQDVAITRGDITRS